MPSFATHERATNLRVLMMGNPGGGKTGSIAALANAGFRVVVLDLDNGLDIWHSYLTPEARERVYFETMTDRMLAETVGQIQYTRPAGTPTAFPKSMTLLDNWEMPERVVSWPDGTKTKTPKYRLGPIADWGPDTILVIDSLTALSYACMYFCIALNEGDKPSQRWLDWYPQDYKHCQRRIEGLLERLKSKQIRCNVILTAHLRYMGGGGVQVTKQEATQTETRKELDSAAEGHAYPMTLGRQLPPMIGSYFNCAVAAEQEIGRIKIITENEGQYTGLKKPVDTLPRYLYASKGKATGGLVELFAACGIKAPTNSPKVA